ncbi:hypothetical protein D0T56_15900 [Dysgonomonas sp. 520]|nr:hypothetical protein [Dysgonomonas sp. 520]
MGKYKKLQIAFWSIYALFVIYLIVLCTGNFDLSNYPRYIVAPLIVYGLVNTAIHILMKRERKKQKKTNVENEIENLDYLPNLSSGK